MKRTWLVVALLGTAGTAASPRFSRALGPGNPIRPESRLWFTGASSIRHFTCTARRLGGTLDLRGSVTQGPALTGANVAAEPSLNVAVDRLDCGIGLMNRHLHEALQGARHPAIEFRLATYEVDLMGPVPVARITGRVTIAGVGRPVTVAAAVRADTLGALHVRGSYDIRPTEFGIELPRRFRGLITVRDHITVHFDVVLDAADGAADEIVTLRAQANHSDPQMESTHDSHR
jgi:polyisoprenoid-binding protein YceI